MNQVELIVTIIAEASDVPPAQLKSTVRGGVQEIIRRSLEVGEDVREYFEVVPPAKARRILRECRADRAATLKAIALWQEAGPEINARIERRKIAKQILNAK